MLLEGKRGVILGLANKWSLAWGIAKSVHGAGAQLLITYQNERLQKNALELSGSLAGSETLMCDVADDKHLAALAEQIKTKWGGLDFFVHAIAFAQKEDLEGDYLKVSREGFKTAHDVSAYSLTALARTLGPLMEGRGGSIVTLTFDGSQRVFPNYNVMGVAKASLEASVRYLASDLGPKNVRVNAISAGPVKTASAAGVTGFSKMLDIMRERSPLKRNIDAGEVGDAALFLLSPMSRGITGQILYVDSGYHITGM